MNLAELQQALKDLVFNNPGGDTIPAVDYFGDELGRILDEFVDTNRVDLINFKGGYDVLNNTPNLDVIPTIAILEGDAYKATNSGLFFGTIINSGTLIIASKDNPTSIGDWIIIENLASIIVDNQGVAGRVLLTTDIYDHFTASSNISFDGTTLYVVADARISGLLQINNIAERTPSNGVNIEQISVRGGTITASALKGVSGSDIHLNGEDLFLYGGDPYGVGDRGDIYFGTGSEGSLSARVAETNIIYYDPATGKLSFGGSFSDWFSLEGTAPNQYIRCYFPFASDYEIQAYTDFNQFPPTIWESMPLATSTSIGGIQLGSGNTLFLREDGTWQTVSTGSSMVYPSGSGIPIVVSGTSWGTTITDNSTNWNTAYTWVNTNGANAVTAYGWGNHASAGYLTSQISHADVVVDGDFTSQGIMLRGASSGVYSILTNNSANWNTAYGWGDHAGLYRPITYVPAHNDTTSKQGGTTNEYYHLTANLYNAFEYVPNSGDPYLRVKLPIACDYEIQAYTDFSQFPPTIWESMPLATSTTIGGIQLGSGSTLFLREDGTWQAAGGSGTTYWSKSGTNLSPLTAGDDILLPNGDKIGWNDGNTYIAGVFSGSQQLNFYVSSVRPFYLTQNQIWASYPISLSNAGASPWTLSNISGNISAVHSLNTGGTGYSLLWRGGESSSITATHYGGDLTLAGGPQSGTGGGHGGNVYIYGGSSVSSTRGNVYLGSGSAGYLPAKGSETNVVYYDTATGKLSYGTASSGGTTPVDSTLLDWSTDRYQPYATSAAGALYTGTTNPTDATRLNYGGYFYATRLYSNAYQVITTSSGTAGSAGYIAIYNSVTSLNAETGFYLTGTGDARQLILPVVLRTVQGTTGHPSIYMPPGASPSSPEAGDMWFNNEGLVVYSTNNGAMQLVSGSHAHGDITAVGAITSTAITPGSGDYLILSDSTASNVLKRGIAIGTGTTTYLRNDGTWATPPSGITGSGTNTHLAIWSSSSNITSNSNLTYDGAVLTIARGINLTAPSTNQTGSGIRSAFTAGEALVFGNLVYMKNDGKVWKAAASSITTTPVMGMCMGSVSANGTADILLSGRVYNSSWSLGTGGDVLYLTTSAGGFSVVAPSGVTGYVVQVIGVVLSATTIYLNPSLNRITLA